MGTGVIGGMLTATSIAILLVPMMFVVIEKVAIRMKKKN
jgi:multidrug efflux pump